MLNFRHQGPEMTKEAGPRQALPPRRTWGQTAALVCSRQLCDRLAVVAGPQTDKLNHSRIGDSADCNGTQRLWLATPAP